jgi:predicted CXXCH cytochrome family protein
MCSGRLLVVMMSTGLVLSGACMELVRAQEAGQRNGCVDCHRSLPDRRLSSPVTAVQGDVHERRGFSCADCHGGDPSAADKARAKAAGTGFRGAPRGATQIVACARCHSDAAFMRRFVPTQRVDQAAQYAASHHGKLLAAGDQRVATCANCHGAHGVRAVADARSPVFPSNVAGTCAACHGDPERMKRPGGGSIGTTQHEEYRQSVHHAALAKGDLSAPTCNDCHGNHGAAPPELTAVANACGSCHSTFAEKFKASKHAGVMDTGCVLCHANHAVLPASDDMLGTSSAAVCTMCHSAGDPGFAAAGGMRAQIERLKAGIAHATGAVAGAKNAGMDMGRAELGLAEAGTALVRARTDVHAFTSAADVEPSVSEGLRLLTDVERAAETAQQELRFRRRGLGASLVAILLVIGAIAIKIRHLDRRGGDELPRAD